MEIVSLNGKYTLSDGGGPMLGHGGHTFRLYMKTGVVYHSDVWYGGDKINPTEKINCLKVESAYNPYTDPLSGLMDKSGELRYYVPNDLKNSYLEKINTFSRDEIISYLTDLLGKLAEDNASKYEVLVLENILEDQKETELTLRFHHHSMYDSDVKILKALSEETEPSDKLLYEAHWGSSLSSCYKLLTEIKESYIESLREKIWGYFQNGAFLIPLGGSRL